MAVRTARPSSGVGGILLVCATALEMRAAVALLPGAEVLDLAPWDKGALLSRSGPPLPRLASPHPASQRLTLLVCGVGPVVSALTLGRELALAGARSAPYSGVLGMGFAGTYAPEAAPVGSVVLATEECLPEYGVWPLGDEPGPLSPEPLRFAQGVLPEGEVFTRLPLEGEKALGNMGLNCHSELLHGVGVTVAGVSGTPRRAAHLAALTGGLMESMEGFSLAVAAAAAETPFAEVRAVSNLAGYRPPHTWNIGAASEALGRAAAALFAPTA